MKKFLFIAVCLVLMASAPASAFVISNYNTRMDIQRDSSVEVTETITADFTGDPRHGIFREIPLAGKDKYGNNYKFRYKILGVTDETGARRKYELSRKAGGRIRFKIGDPNITVSDKQTYVIKYTLLRAVHFFNQYDELYWNVVGAEWEVPIQQTSAIVTIPKDVPKSNIQTAAYTGHYGATTSEALSDVPNGRTARFWMQRTLSPGEAMTIVVGWPKGIVKQPSTGQEAWWFIADNAYFFLPPVFLVLLFAYWAKVGKDPNTGKSVMVAYAPPDNIRPAELGTLIDERVDVRDIASSIIDLAVRGYIHIKSDVQKGFLSSKTDYLLQLQKPYNEVIADQSLLPFERTLMRGLFSAGESRWISSLSNSFYVHMSSLKDKLYDSMVKRGYFAYRPDSVRTSYAAGGGIFAVAALAAALLSFDGDIPLMIAPGWFLALSLCGAFVLVSSKTMPRKTHKGRDAFIAVKGFEEYLNRAEKQDIEFQEKHELFEKFLPYALALGIADKWARAFEGLGLKPPDWYTGDGDTFHPMIFAHDLNIATSSWGSAMTSQPRSSGSGGGSSFFGGGSGFGGGSSGGGGGGGGGGGW